MTDQHQSRSTIPDRDAVSGETSTTQVGPELQDVLRESGITLHAHATGVVTRPDGSVRHD